ncbi:hypothetical protein BH24CHL1_BH24CHL1_06340 [soil metagenome]
MTRYRGATGSTHSLWVRCPLLNDTLRPNV